LVGQFTKKQVIGLPLVGQFTKKQVIALPLVGQIKKQVLGKAISVNLLKNKFLLFDWTNLQKTSSWHTIGWSIY